MKSSPPKTPESDLKAKALEDAALRDKLQRHARTRLRQRVDVDDVVQDCLLRAYKKWHTFDPAMGPLDGWVFGILNLVLLEEYRKQKKQPMQASAGPPGWDQLESQVEISPVAELSFFLAQLSGEDRQLVIWHHIDGLSHDEIASKLGISSANSRVRLARAMRELKQLAAKEGTR